MGYSRTVGAAGEYESIKTRQLGIHYVNVCRPFTKPISIMTKSKVYTCTGDTGATSLVGGVRVKKTDIRIEAYGSGDHYVNVVFETLYVIM